MQKDIHGVTEWCKRWKLNLNPSKCNVLSFSTNTDQIYFKYTLNEPIKRENVVKDLGIYMNSQLNYGHHISTVVNTAFKLLGMLKRQCLFIKKKSTVLLLYKIIVRSKLEYASIVWNPSIKTSNEKLERVQTKFVRFFCYKFNIHLTHLSMKKSARN